jgi:hypothetical protein
MQRAGTTAPAGPKPTEVFTLHKYFISASLMGHLFREKLKADGAPQDFSQSWIELDVLMRYWYVGLFVVIEGWQGLKLADTKIDQLLQSPNVDLLRRFRNGVCHFQVKYFDKRFMDLFHEQSMVTWLHTLSSEFGRFFLEFMRAQESGTMIPPELKQKDD